MRIGIISDTHISEDTSKFEAFLKDHFNDMDFVIHAGDYKANTMVKNLLEFPNFKGVWGNNDDKETQELLAEEQLIELKGYKIGIFHGHGKKGTTIERAYQRFENQGVDVIVFGHSHQPIICTKSKILMLNPGSPTDKRRERWFSYIILHLEEGIIKAELNFVE